MINNTEITNLPLSDIKVDPACQARVTTDATKIAEYAEIMTEEGDVFPPVVTYYDGTAYWLSDGFHRYAAAEKAGLGSLKAETRQGTRRDAILYAVGANATLRRTIKDKRHAVGILLADEEWSKWSNRTIAHRCGVDEKLVRTLRSASAAKPQIARKVERGGNVYHMNTSNIGKQGAADQPPQQPDLDDGPEQVWDNAQPPAVELSDDQEATLSELHDVNDEVQLKELMSAWARSSADIRQRFLAWIGVSLTTPADADPPTIEPAPETSQSSDPSQSTEPSTTELQENPLVEVWNGLKGHTKTYGRMWVEAGCQAKFHPAENPYITERLVPFRAAALTVTPQQVEEFLELTRAA